MDIVRQEESRSKRIIVWTIVGILALFWTLVAGMPFFYLILTSLKSQPDFLSGNFFKVPESLSFDNYKTVIEGNFMNYFGNSLIVLAVSLTILLLASAFAAYPLARMKFKLNQPIFALIVAAMSVPIHITLIPIFSMTIDMGLYDSIWALIGPYVAFNLPISIFILRSFMVSIPVDIEEAAEIDGCGKFGTFFRIIFPLSKPGLATLAIYNGVNIWNEFSFVMVLTQSQQNRTLPLAIWEYQGQYSMNIPVIMAVLTLSALPIILLYIVGQDKLIKGMMAGAVKG